MSDHAALLPRVLHVKAVTALGRVHRRRAWRIPSPRGQEVRYRILRPWPRAQWLQVFIDVVPGQASVGPLPELSFPTW